MSKEIKGDIYTRSAAFKLDIERVFKKLLDLDKTVFLNALMREVEIKYRLPHKTINKEIQAYIKAGQIDIFEEDGKKIIAVIKPWVMENQELF